MGLKESPRERFSATVDAYRKHRPGYPEALWDWLLPAAGWRPGDLVVDLGCGTGITARALAARGVRVVGVDPNEAMLAAAREDEREGIEYRSGDAEAIPVADEGATGLIGGQCFHWFDLDRALPEIARVVGPEGLACAFWNTRDPACALMREYEELLLRECGEYKEVRTPEQTLADLQAHPRVSTVEERGFPYGHRHDREGFFGRAWSSSYVVHSVMDREAFDRALGDLFEAHATGGHVEFRYRTRALLFRPR